MDRTTGVADRKLPSWIDAFIEVTTNLDAPLIYRRWTAISVLAATVTQRVWVKTSSNLYPNIYLFMIGHPGVGKSRTISVGRRLVQGLSEFHLAPISMTFASLVDSMNKAKTTIAIPGQDPITFNSLYICADELGAFIHKYEPEMIDGLAAFYDPAPYRQTRRGNDLDIKVDSPQINLLAGSTPQNLIGFMPEKAWGMGFSSRCIMIFSDERIIGDDFAPRESPKTGALKNDLAAIANLWGQFHVTEDYRNAVNNWRQLGEPPVPDHPKLIHYITRRKTHLYKLSMVASIDRANTLVLTVEDFNRALGWLIEAEETMPDIFKAGSTSVDSQAMDEIFHLIALTEKDYGVSEQKIIRFAKDRVPLHSIGRVIDIMERSGQIFCLGVDKRSGVRYFTHARQHSQAEGILRCSPSPIPVLFVLTHIALPEM